MTPLDHLLNSDKVASNTPCKGPDDMTANKDRVSPIGSTVDRASQARAARSDEYRAEQERLAPYEAIARMVIARRIRYALTQERLAERMGTSVSAISRLESGQHRPNVETLEKLGQAFGERLVLGFEDDAGQRELAWVSR
jgi:ribosome-binding protein aMBF1 (putative translation factor)